MFYTLVGLSVGVFMYYIVRPTGYMELPFLTAAVYLGWVIPQLMSMRDGFERLNPYLSTLYAMAILCLLAVLAGWRYGVGKPWVARKEPDPGDLDRLQYAAVIITAIVGMAVLAIDLRPDHEKASATWSGPIVIFYFISNLKIVALSLSGILFFRKRNSMSVLLLAVNIMFYFPAIFVFFRRRAVAEFAIAIALALWFGRGRLMPRNVVVAVLVVGSFFVFAVGQLRDLAKGQDGQWRTPTLEQLTDIGFADATPLRDERQAIELRNALSLVEVSSRSGYHTFGLKTWNRLVFQYVPATLVGASLKRGLMVDVDSTLEQMMYYQLGYVRGFGSTSTGIAEAYVEFWYFGCVFFYLISVIMGRYWSLANRGDVWSQGLYAAGVVPAVITVTAYASYFFVAGFLYFVVLNGIRMVLERKVRQRRSGSLIHSK